MKNILNRKNLFAGVFGYAIGTNMDYPPTELMFWVIAFPILVVGIVLYHNLKEG
jgi:hypothetical protein